MFRNILVAAAVLSTVVVSLPIDTTSAQSVRRHLHCKLVDGVEFEGIIPFSTGKVVIAINNWNRTIPRGTAFTYRIGNSSNGRTFTSTAALPPGGEMFVGSTPTGTSCRVSIPG